MSKNQIIKQDVLNSLKSNLNENNVQDLISEFKLKSELELDIETLMQSYKCYVSNIFLPKLGVRNSGFGRNNYEALKTALFNLFENLLQDDKFIIPIKDSLKIFMKLNSNNNRDIRRSTTNTILNSEIQNKIQHENNDPNLMIINEINIEVCSTYDNHKISDMVRENNLILLELENLIIDMLNYNKKICEIIDTEYITDNLPIYYKCPITWERMESPVVSIEGHSYEKWAIEKWLKSQSISPITGLILDDSKLINNYTLKSAMDDWGRKFNKMRKVKIELQKFLTKCEYDLNDLKKYFNVICIDK